MSIHDYVERALVGAESSPRRMPREQALVYSVERVVESVLPSQVVARRHAHEWLDRICDIEEWDTPSIEAIRSRRWGGVASTELHAIGISSAKTSALLLCHELAHIVNDEQGHGEGWRSTFVGIVRRHVSVQHASLLHTLYQRVGLTVGEWESSRA